MTTAEQLLTDPEIMRNWHREERLTVSEWADANRMLSDLSSNEHGRYQSGRTPYAREWQDSCALAWVRQVTVMAGTQVGKSEAMHNVIGYYVQHRPSPIMMVLPSGKAVKTAGRRRLLPMIRESPSLRAETTGQTGDMTYSEITLRRSVIYVRSAGSPADLASVPVRLVVGDETEKWPEWSGDDADPLSLVRERTRTFFDHVVLLACTPKHQHGIIAREFEAGDQRHYHVPCPHCGAWLQFEWEQVRWDPDVRDAEQLRDTHAAWYECQHCNQRINDLQKIEAVAKGVWIPAAFTPDEWFAGARETDRCRHRSYHLWAAYSPWLTWWQIAAQFLESTQQGDPAKLMNWTTNWLARPWQETVQHAADEAVLACVEARQVGEVPDDVQLITAAVDTQGNRLEWAVQAWGYDEESWLIDAGKIPLMSNGQDWMQLHEKVLRRRFGKHQVRLCLIDSRWRSDEVLDFCRLHQPTTRMIAGVDKSGPDLFTPKKIDRHPRTGIPRKNSMLKWSVQVGWFKDLVAARLTKAITEPETKAGRIRLPNGLPADWLEQISSEHKVVQRSGSKRVERWVLRPGRRRNEAWDLLVYNACAARMLFANLLVSKERLPERNAKPVQGPPIRTRAPGAGVQLPGISRRP